MTFEELFISSTKTEGSHGNEWSVFLLLRAAFWLTDNMGMEPQSGHHKELYSSNSLNDLEEDPEPQMT